MDRLDRLSVNGVELEYVDEGSGVPVLFSHGGASDLRYWEPQRTAFASRHRFIAYSRRFYGAGSWPADADASNEAHARDLVEIVRKLDTGPVHLVGFSAAPPLHAAIAEPGLFRSLTIVEPNVPSLLEGDASGEAMLAWWRRETARVHAEAAGDVKVHAEHWFELVNNQGPGTFAGQPPAFRRMWLENFGAKRSGDAVPLTCEKLGAVSMPTLALGAEHGMPYSRKILDRLAGCIPGCDLVVVPSVTHFMSNQASDVFNRVVLEFVARKHLGTRRG
ncbi:MAG: alpha/beta hydrolase [Chloroflexota bacterium]|nr:alpha/beta hydrolase [Chloroflexota bacterium]